MTATPTWAATERTTILTFFDALKSAGVLRGDTWGAWRSFLCALFALPMTDSEAKVFTECTDRDDLPTEPHGEAWLICGRRSGKSFCLALIAVYLAAFKDWRPYLGPGERATIMVIAQDRKVARVIYRFCRAMFEM